VFTPAPPVPCNVRTSTIAPSGTYLQVRENYAVRDQRIDKSYICDCLVNARVCGTAKDCLINGGQGALQLDRSWKAMDDRSYRPQSLPVGSLDRLITARSGPGAEVISHTWFAERCPCPGAPATSRLATRPCCAGSRRAAQCADEYRAAMTSQRLSRPLASLRSGRTRLPRAKERRPAHYV
jgi:hypothetical protein